MAPAGKHEGYGVPIIAGTQACNLPHPCNNQTLPVSPDTVQSHSGGSVNNTKELAVSTALLLQAMTVRHGHSRSIAAAGTSSAGLVCWPVSKAPRSVLPVGRRYNHVQFTEYI